MKTEDHLVAYALHLGDRRRREGQHGNRQKVDLGKQSLNLAAKTFAPHDDALVVETRHAAPDFQEGFQRTAVLFGTNGIRRLVCQGGLNGTDLKPIPNDLCWVRKFDGSRVSSERFERGGCSVQRLDGRPVDLFADPFGIDADTKSFDGA